MDYTKRLRDLIEEGARVLATHRRIDGVIGFPTLDSGSFGGWKARCLNVLTAVGGADHEYVKQFRKHVTRGYEEHAETGIELVRSMLSDLEQGPSSPR